MSIRGVLGSVVLAAATVGASGCKSYVNNSPEHVDAAHFLVTADEDTDGRLSHKESMAAIYVKYKRGKRNDNTPLTNGELHQAMQLAEKAKVYVPKLADDFIATIKILGYVEPK